jgi:hypothetical protein
MKTLGRILIILLAAAIVIGGTYALLQSSAAQALVGQPIDSGSENGNRPTSPGFANGQGASAGEMHSGDRERGSGSWETVGRNLLQLVAVIAVVQVLWSIGRWLKRTVASLAQKNRLSPNRG